MATTMTPTKKCTHPNLEIMPPCCTGNFCACLGLYRFWCEDCKNSDLTQEQIEDVMNGQAVGEDDEL